MSLQAQIVGEKPLRHFSLPNLPKIGQAVRREELRRRVSVQCDNPSFGSRLPERVFDLTQTAALLRPTALKAPRKAVRVLHEQVDDRLVVRPLVSSNEAQLAERGAY